MPPLGFPDCHPKISFSDTATFPQVSTCTLTFTLPYSLPSDEEEYKDKMNFAILNSQGFFGQV